MIEYDGEMYVTASEVARQFHISRGTCYNNLLRQVEKYYLPGRKHALYRQADLAPFAVIRMEVPRKTSPAPPKMEAAGGNGTSSPASPRNEVEDWHGQYSVPAAHVQAAPARPERSS